MISDLKNLRIKIIILTFILISVEIYSHDLPTHRREGTIGASLGYGLANRLPFIRLGKGDEYVNNVIGNRISSYDFNIFYNFNENQTLGLRVQKLDNWETIKTYDYGIDTLGNYNVKSNFSRPNIEVFYKFYLFDTSFYVAPIFGVSSPKNVQIVRSNSFLLEPIKRDYLSPYGVEYNIASRIYGGVDIGYGFTFFENIFMNIGYMVKVASKPNIKANYYLGLGDFVDYFNDFKAENSIYSSFIYSNINEGILDLGLGSSSVYIEAGLVY